MDTPQKKETSFSFRGINPLTSSSVLREHWSLRLAAIKRKIDVIGKNSPKQAVLLSNTHSNLINWLSDDDLLRSPSQKNSTRIPKTAPKWLRDDIEFLEAQVDMALSEQNQ